MIVTWIQSAERMPPEGATCWIVSVYDDGSRSVERATYDGRATWWSGDDDIPATTVTHWAPYDEPELPPTEEVGLPPLRAAYLYLARWMAIRNFASEQLNRCDDAVLLE